MLSRSGNAGQGRIRSRSAGDLGSAELAIDSGKREFRLPTESAWEVVARSGSRTAYGFGKQLFAMFSSRRDVMLVIVEPIDRRTFCPVGIR
jgi:hypothetical protein